MKSLVKVAALFFILLPFSVNAVNTKREKISTLSKEALEQMRLQQNLDNLTITNYQAFERTIYYFINLKEKAINPLIEYLKSNKKNDEIVVPTIYALGRMGPYAERAVPVIMPFLDSPNRDIVLTSIAALGKIGKGSDRAVPQLYALASNKSDAVFSNAALTALERINTPSARGVFKEIENEKLLEKKRKEQEREKMEQEGLSPPSQESTADVPQ